ncbi:hypothetical protein [Luedemannella helvata]|uniref:Uncharacterized protein n=1 Tax=Luedemannella helvata TaxID=349315 RepID=A0ABP4WN62_9ACTN
MVDSGPDGVAALSQAAQAHRLVAALVVAAARAGAEPAALPALRERLLLQQARFAEVAAANGVPVPSLAPTPAEVSGARTALGDLSAATVAEAVTTGASTLDLADRLLAAPGSVRFADPPAPAPAPAAGNAGTAWPRNALIYGAYAGIVLVMQLIIFLGVADEISGVFWAPLCGLVFPVIAWVAGYLTIGRAPRSPRLGALICFAPNVVLCCALGLLAWVR